MNVNMLPKKSLKDAARALVDAVDKFDRPERPVSVEVRDAAEVVRSVLVGERAFRVARAAVKEADATLRCIGIDPHTEPRTLLTRLFEVLDAEARRIEEGSPEALTAREVANLTEPRPIPRCPHCGSLQHRSVTGAARVVCLGCNKDYLPGAPPMPPQTVIPVRLRRTHVVVTGDTVFDIANRYGVAWREVAEANRLPIQPARPGHITHHVHIEAGWELIIPGSPT